MIIESMGKKVRFGDLGAGETFKFNNNFYIVTDCLNDNDRRFCVNLLNGHMVNMFVDDDIVYDVEVKGVIEYDD